MYGTTGRQKLAQKEAIKLLDIRIRHAKEATTRYEHILHWKETSAISFIHRKVVGCEEGKVQGHPGIIIWYMAFGHGAAMKIRNYIRINVVLMRY